ncbi:hypothetical protein TPHA_0A00540 [Tetrapisispora phaffii CBS 4417]|uniref:Prokaryotic-type class I peptide chain release factors domain-containing protein n=1 Tax=Tetrapisispora phaffii (strain ATCC 24235 / CBS 4417 / NBRC 1672 / NRRL Y-8282 / UCD 70-5) TaxID=1071381 RepID=G8BML1_TETPH|nr:hypothetical protein TPHA_0A00540 [Tetrapisispora phaffii CBS 4417]CCE61139.1 hypothetical protein TPHA_0A00540 [Tetrapisispora phaffii CBS 4417]
MTFRVSFQFFTKCYSNVVIKELSNNTIIAKNWLNQLNISSIPKNLLKERFDRSSGPGGQNVNKLNTKCTLSLPHVSGCDWIPQEVRKQLVNGSFRYYKKTTDMILVQADETRSREDNRMACKTKLINEIKKHCTFQNVTRADKMKKWERSKNKDNELRIQKKKTAK